MSRLAGTGLTIVYVSQLCLVTEVLQVNVFLYYIKLVFGSFHEEGLVSFEEGKAVFCAIIKVTYDVL